MTRKPTSLSWGLADRSVSSLFIDRGETNCFFVADSSAQLLKDVKVGYLS
mgnify:CR=1 FL=1